MNALPELPEPSAYAFQMITEDAFSRGQMLEFGKASFYAGVAYASWLLDEKRLHGRAVAEACARICDDLSNQWPIDDNLFDLAAKRIRESAKDIGK